MMVYEIKQEQTMNKKIEIHLKSIVKDRWGGDETDQISLQRNPTFPNSFGERKIDF